MIAFLHAVAMWLADYYAVATVLIAVTLAALAMLRQPVKRVALAWAALIGLALLLAITALPFWPRIPLVAGAAPQTTAPVPAVSPVPSDAPGPLERIAPIPEQRFVAPWGAPIHRPRMPEHLDRAAAPARQEPAVAAAFDPRALVAVLFALGATAVAVWLVAGAIQVARLCAAAQPAPEFATNELARLVGGQGRVPRLLVSHRLASAAACGLWRPTILLPASVLPDATLPSSSEGRAKLVALLAHELAHVRRGDLWLVMLARVLLGVLWAHPLFWLLRRRVRIDVEIVADAAAAASCTREEFAAWLVAWARQLPAPPAWPRASLGMWRRQAELSRRIHMLVNQRMHVRTNCSRVWKCTTAITALTIIAALSLATLRPAAPTNTVAADKPGEPQAKPTKLAIRGVCLDSHERPVAGAYARLFRVDAGTDYVGHASCRVRLESALPDAKLNGGDRPLLGGGVRCDRESQRLLAECRTDETGRIEFPPLPVDSAWASGSSTLWVCVQAPGMATAWGRAMIDERGEASLVPPECKMLQAATLRGRVTDQAGRSVAGALVGAGGADGGTLPKPIPGIECALTDADGRYEIADLAPFDIASALPQPTPFGVLEYVSAAGWIEHPAFASQVIEYTKLPGVADAVLVRPATLTMQVIDGQDGTPLDKALLSWTSEQQGARSANADERGACVADRLVPGPYTVTASVFGRLSVVETIDVKEGANELTLRIPRSGTLKGRLIDDATGERVAIPIEMQANVTAVLADGKPEQGTSGMVDRETGAFSFAVRPGRNKIGLFVLDNNAFANWELIDTDRWTVQGVDVGQDEIVEIELRTSPRKGVPPLVGDSLAKWRTRLMATEPWSEETLRAMIDRQQFGVTRESIGGKDEIIAISASIGSPDLGSLYQTTVLERSLLAHIQKFPHVRMLMLFHPPGGDAAFAPLASLQHLEMLQVCDLLDDVSGASVAHLAKLPKLRTLWLCSRKLDDDALGQIARLPNLQELLCAGDFTDEGLRHLAGNRSLTQLTISTTAPQKLGDAGLAHLGKMTQLKELALTMVLGCWEQEQGAPEPDPWAITDDGLRHLAGLVDLEELSLLGKDLTDAGLVHLRGLKNLKTLRYDHTRITPAGIDELRKSLPDLKKPN